MLRHLGSQGGGQASLEALEVTRKLSDRFPNAHIVVLPKEMSVLARDAPNRATKNVLGHIQSNLQPYASELNVPMASVFFPSLIVHLIGNEIDKNKQSGQMPDYEPNGDGGSSKCDNRLAGIPQFGAKNAQDNDRGGIPQVSFEDILKSSLSFTKKWMDQEVERLRVITWVPPEEQKLEFTCGPNTDSFGVWKGFVWDEEIVNWRASFFDLGIIELKDSRGVSAPKKVFQLWRSMTDVDGYVSCLPSKRKILQKLLEQGNRFSTHRRDRHESFLLIDRPGSGKSFLVGKLAKALRMRFLAFNVTQMLTRQDILHSFDTIVTSHAQDPEQATLVFIDEINAKLDGHHIYDTFLGPLEEGLYIRSGNKFHIDPCMWVFAGTELPGKGQHDGKSDKGSDFVSRLTLPYFDLNRVGNRSKEIALAEIERVYIGVASIRNAFPDVRQISEKVLRAFVMLPNSTGPREIGTFVKSFDFIQYGRVESRHVPDNWISGFDLSDEFKYAWRELDEGDLIEIKSDAAD